MEKVLNRAIDSSSYHVLKTLSMFTLHEDKIRVISLSVKFKAEIVPFAMHIWVLVLIFHKHKTSLCVWFNKLTYKILGWSNCNYHLTQYFYSYIKKFKLSVTRGDFYVPSATRKIDLDGHKASLNDFYTIQVVAPQKHIAPQNPQSWKMLCQSMTGKNKKI